MADWRQKLADEIHTRGVKLTKLSEELGFHRDYVSNVLAARANPTAEKLEAICNHIGIPLATILLGPTDSEATDAEIEELNRMPLERVQELILDGKFDNLSDED